MTRVSCLVCLSAFGSKEIIELFSIRSTSAESDNYMLQFSFTEFSSKLKNIRVMFFMK